MGGTKFSAHPTWRNDVDISTFQAALSRVMTEAYEWWHDSLTASANSPALNAFIRNPGIGALVGMSSHYAGGIHQFVIDTPKLTPLEKLAVEMALDDALLAWDHGCDDCKNLTSSLLTLSIC